MKKHELNISLSVTEDVSEYVLYHKGTEVHLIDSPGFDDCSTSDHEVLDKISTWINTVYSRDWTIGGILYMYDVRRMRLGGSGQTNIRVLEELTGKDRWRHISLVTNFWHPSHNQQDEERREKELESDARAWKSLRQGNRPARLCRFDNTKESALEIIEWHLDQSCVPALTQQMADPQGPQLSIRDTDAGKVILNSLTPMLLQKADAKKIREVDEVLGHKFDDRYVRFAIQGLMADLAKAKREHRLQQIGRWAIRLSMIGGVMTAVLVTENPAILATGLLGAGELEESLRRRRAMKKEEIAAIEKCIFDAFKK